MADDTQPMVCNLDARGDRRRARFGGVLTVVTIAVAAVVVLRDLSPWWSLAVLLPAYGAALGFLQANAST